MSEVTWRNGALEVSAEAVITNLPAATRRRSYYQAIKRTADLVLAGAGLLVLGPVFLLLALVIRLDSRGSAFFSQVRVGEGGQEFRCWKFRSMYVDAEERKAELETENEMAGGVIFKMKRDPRITRVGRFIRKSSIDELPQLWNVFIGDMSLVGPRPAVPVEVAQYTPYERRRLDVLDQTVALARGARRVRRAHLLALQTLASDGIEFKVL